VGQTPNIQKLKNKDHPNNRYRYGMHYQYHYNDLTNKNKTQLKTYYC